MELDNKLFFQIPKFENYVLNKDNFTIKNLKNDKELKPIRSKGVKKFRLSKNGQYQIVSLWDILLAIFHTKNDLK